MPKLVQVIGFVLMVLAVILLWAGVLQPVQVQTQKNPVMYGVYLKHYGSYAQIPGTLSEVKRYVKQKGIDSDSTFGVYFQDPEVTPSSLLTSWVGVVVREPVEVEEPYELYTFEERDNVHAQFIGHPVIAPWKTVSKIEAFQRRLSLDHGLPWVEIYTPYKYGQYIVDVWAEYKPFVQKNEE